VAVGGCESGGAGERGSGADGAETVEFAFGAAFASIRAVRIREPRDTPGLEIRDLLPDNSGRFWVRDSASAAIRIFSQQGRCLRVLDPGGIRVRAPAGLTPVHQRWIAVLDGELPAIVVLDERGAPLRRFPLPELDHPVQVCNLDDRLLAVTGSGWGRGQGRMLHLYTLTGEYQESLFAEPRHGRRAFVATAGTRLYLGHRGGDSFSVYDVDARSILSFPSQAWMTEAEENRGGMDGRLDGMFATRCGALLAVYGDERSWCFTYDLYGLDGTTLATRLRTRERVVGVEGPLFYSVRRDGDDLLLRVWKLKAWKERRDDERG